MSENDPTAPINAEQPNFPPPPPPPPPMTQQMGSNMATYGQPVGPAPIGQIRSTGMCIVLTIVTLGFYSLYWWYAVHEEMKRNTGRGLGGLLALLLAIFVGIAMPYVTSNEVGDVYAQQGKARPVTWVTGLWYFPGIFILIGPIVWFVKTNGAINDYWRSLGAV